MCISLLMCAGMACPAFAEEGRSLRKAYLESSGGFFVVPSSDELAQGERMFEALFEGKVDDDILQVVVELGFNFERIKRKGRESYVVSEQGDRKQGRGFYIFNPVATSRALQMPHRYKDFRTGNIGYKLCTSGEFAVCAFNTVPRWKEDGEFGRGNHEQDLAHRPDTWFKPLTCAFARVYPHGSVIQLHGYSGEYRKTEAGREYKVIVSSGQKISSERVVALGACLNALPDTPTGVYPEDVEELGGTTNVSGKELRRMGHPGFVHIEMDSDVRMRLMEDSKYRKKFVLCLEELP